MLNRILDFLKPFGWRLLLLLFNFLKGSFVVFVLMMAVLVWSQALTDFIQIFHPHHKSYIHEIFNLGRVLWICLVGGLVGSYSAGAQSMIDRHHAQEEEHAQAQQREKIDRLGPKNQ